MSTVAVVCIFFLIVSPSLQSSANFISADADNDATGSATGATATLPMLSK